MPLSLTGEGLLEGLLGCAQLDEPWGRSARMPPDVWEELPPIIRHARVSRQKRELARRLRRRATASERLAWELLRGRRLLGLKFRRQQVIRGYVVDFYCAELRVALEIDGAYHDDPGQAEYDLNRTVQLWEMGVITLRMWAEEVSAEALVRLFEPIVQRARREAGRPGGDRDLERRSSGLPDPLEPGSFHFRRVFRRT